MKKLDEIVRVNYQGRGCEMASKEQIAKEQRLKASYISNLNHWLDKENCVFRVINYGACGFKGSKEDNEKTVRTIKFFIKNGLGEYVKEKFA